MGIDEEANHEETATVKHGGGGRWLLVLSLIVNVALASACGYMYSMNQRMSAEAAEYVSSLN